MYLKFLLIYFYLIINYGKCVVLSASFGGFNYGTNLRPQYRAPAFKSTGSFTPAQNNLHIIKPGVNKLINSFTGNFAVNAPLKPVNTWPNANTYPNPPPRPSVWNTAAAPKPVIQNDWPYARQPAYNPHFKIPPRLEVQNDRTHVKELPYNPNFNVPQQPKPPILNPGPAPRAVVHRPPYNPHINAVPKPVIQNDWHYAKQPAYNPHFQVPPTPANRNLGPNQRQPPYNPHFKETIQNNDSTKPSSSTRKHHLSRPHQPAYNVHIELPNQGVPSNSSDKKVSGPTTLSQGSMQRQPRQNPLMPETSTVKSHVLSSISTLYPLMTTAHHTQNDHGKNVASKFAGVLGALNTFVKKFSKNHHSTNDKQTFEYPLLLSPEDSEDKFPVVDLLNSYSPKDSNPSSLRQSLQKGVISNKLPAVHRYNLKTKQFYKGKPFILAAIVISSVVAMTALIGGIIFCSKKKNQSK